MQFRFKQAFISTYPIIQGINQDEDLYYSIKVVYGGNMNFELDNLFSEKHIEMSILSEPSITSRKV